jgi:hypothetical protein
MHVSRSLNELQRLGSNACSQISTATLQHCYEFDASDLTRLSAARTAEELSGPLTFLWTDLRQRAPQPQPLIECAFYKTAYAIWNSSSLSSALTPLHDLCDRVFDALAAAPPHVQPRAPRSQLLADVLVEKCTELQSRGTLEWLRLANSCCAIWPNRTADLFAFLEEPRGHECALEYLCALAYPTNDHPWSPEPIALWARYGVHEELVWPEPARKHLARLLSDAAVCTRLASLPRDILMGRRAGASLATVVDEILKVQLDFDFRRRRQILLHHLAVPNSDLVWNDEWGIDV